MEFIQKQSKVILLLIVLMFILASKAGADVIIDRVNLYRNINGIPSLTENDSLNQSATHKACDLSKKKYWSHYSPSGVTPWELMTFYGYNYDWAGENIARNCKNSQCVKMWIESETHRDNMLFYWHNDIGVGRCGKYTVIHMGSKQP